MCLCACLRVYIFVCVSVRFSVVVEQPRCEVLEGGKKRDAVGISYSNYTFHPRCRAGGVEEGLDCCGGGISLKW